MFGNFSSFKTPFLGWVSTPTSFVSLFIIYILSNLLSKTMGCLSGCPMSSASIQKLFCGICSASKCSFDEFVGGESGLPVLFLCHLRTTPLIFISQVRFLILTKSSLSVVCFMDPIFVVSSKSLLYSSSCRCSPILSSKRFEFKPMIHVE